VLLCCACLSCESPCDVWVSNERNLECSFWKDDGWKPLQPLVPSQLRLLFSSASVSALASAVADVGPSSWTVIAPSSVMHNDSRILLRHNIAGLQFVYFFELDTTGKVHCATVAKGLCSYGTLFHMN